MKLKDLLNEDLKQFKHANKEVNLKDFIQMYITKPCYRYVVYFRICKYTKGKKHLFVLYLIFRVLFRRLSIKLGIQIPYNTNIGGGFSIHHYSCIVIHGKTTIGKNFNLRHGVTIGDINGGFPLIGDNVTVGAGAKILGGITIGDNVKIGANAVVTKDVPSNSTVVGFNRIV